ncbi:hypothetical protein JOF41_005123 [Saccharothrix coeruleofusca]|uniref:hypothetical protein n=1 Tax=Saccharothrix coeruleofusca TaxID=33919 RepID=UPI001AE20D3F|nr:hypothetical protein [Saccharothrix coeruleofusca]MBP2338945.1 hypothetical protein [Saccharothrix coeruleofusca]
MSSTLVGIVEPAPIDRIADELYALPPVRFTATRDARAREAAALGDRALAERVAALRKPTRAAWALNLLAREAADDLAEAAELGGLLRAAQEELRGGALRELGERRRVVLGELVRRAEELAVAAGHPLGPDAVQQVRTTLTSALVDAVLAARIRAGRLVRPVERSGFGPEPTGGAPVRDDLAPRREQRRERSLTRAREDVVAAQDGLRHAESAVTEAEGVLAERQERAAELRAELRRAQRDEHEAATRAERARRRAEVARNKLERARERLSELRGDA